MTKRYLTEAEAWRKIAVSFERYALRDQLGLAWFGLCNAIRMLRHSRAVSDPCADRMLVRLQKTFDPTGQKCYYWGLDDATERAARVTGALLLAILAEEDAK